MNAEQKKVITFIKLYGRLQNLYPEWKTSRQTITKDLKEIAQYLHKLERGITVSNVTTSAVGIPLGTACLVSTIVSLVLIPVTGGASAAIAGVIAASTGIAGGVIGAGSAIANLTHFGIKKAQAKKLKKHLQEDKEKTKTIINLLEKMNRMRNSIDFSSISVTTLDKFFATKDGINTAIKLGTIGNGIADTVEASTKLLNIVRGGGSAADAAMDGVSMFTTLSTFSKFFKVAGAVGSGIGVAIDVVSLVWNSIKIHKGTGCELATKMEEIAKELDQQLKCFVDEIEPQLAG